MNDVENWSVIEFDMCMYVRKYEEICGSVDEYIDD